MAELYADYDLFTQYVVTWLTAALSATTLTIGRGEPTPAQFPYVRVMDPLPKTEDTIKAGATTHLHLVVPLLVCTNETTIEASRRQAWIHLDSVEKKFRGNMQMTSSTHPTGFPALAVTYPEEARGEDYAGREYRIEANVYAMLQKHA